MLYSEASHILNKLYEKRGSVKQLTFSSEYKNKKQLFALVCETLKYGDVIEEILGRTGLLKREAALDNDVSLAHVLVYDLVFGCGLQKSLPRELKEPLLQNESVLKRTLEKIKAKRNVSRNVDLLSGTTKQSVSLPRFVRVNLLKTSVDDVLHKFAAEGYTEVTAGRDYKSYVEQMRSLLANEMMRDIHLSDVLVFAAGTDLHCCPLYLSGDIILQDKASCIPAHVLSAPPGVHVVDCCAAPGNKTSHVAATMANSGRIFAFDKDTGRLATMKALMHTAGVTNVTMTNADFLCVDPNNSKYRDVRYAIVDPSCSGSGIVSRLDSLTDGASAADSKRLEKLAAFQARILTHAMSFPSMQRLIYSTCSKSERENEGVVTEAMQRVAGYRLGNVLPGLPSRGQGELQACLRLTPQDDLTNGFFVACLERDDTVSNIAEVRHGKRKRKKKEKNTNSESKPQVTTGQPAKKKPRKNRRKLRQPVTQKLT